MPSTGPKFRKSLFDDECQTKYKMSYVKFRTLLRSQLIPLSSAHTTLLDQSSNKEMTASSSSQTAGSSEPPRHQTGFAFGVNNVTVLRIENHSSNSPNRLFERLSSEMREHEAKLATAQRDDKTCE